MPRRARITMPGIPWHIHHSWESMQLFSLLLWIIAYNNFSNLKLDIATFQGAYLRGFEGHWIYRFTLTRNAFNEYRE